MYTSPSSDQDFERRRQLAAEEARAVYGRSVVSPTASAASVPAPEPIPPAEESAVFASSPVSSERSGGLSSLFSRFKEDDLLLIALFFLLFNESKKDDPLILLILAVLFFT